jgi:hypothetical protein
MKNIFLSIATVLFCIAASAQKTSIVNPTKLISLLQEKTKATVTDFVEIQTKPSDKDTTRRCLLSKPTACE